MPRRIFSQQSGDNARIVREAEAYIRKLERRIAQLEAGVAAGVPSGAINIADTHPNLTDLADAGPTINAFFNSVVAAAGRVKIYFPPGDYNIATPVSHPANIWVCGAGPFTRFLQVGSNTVWDFQTGFLRARLTECQILGSGRSDPNDFSLRVGIGIDLAQSQKARIFDVQVWDFLTGIRCSDGVAFSAYHTLGPDIEVNRCTTGLYAPDEFNITRFFDSRVFYSYGDADEGIGIDCDQVGAFKIDNVAIEACDTCLRVRSSSPGLTQLRCDSNYYEPGTNPETSTVGRAYDIVIVGQNDETESFTDDNSVISANAGDIVVPPEGFMRVDGYSRAFFGARFNGAAVPKRNLVRNGTLNNWALPDTLPGWVGGGSLPTLAENTTDFITGSRSMDVTATSTGDAISATFTVSDPGVEWVTCGVRYRAATGNTGFYFSASVGGETRQLTDEEDADEWRVRWVQCPVGAANRDGAIIIVPDSVDGTGLVTIDEVWAVPGRYAIPSTQYGERVELLPAPIEIYNSGTITANETFGPIDLTNLHAALGAPLDDMSGAPEGVVGAIIRVRIEVDDGSGTGALTFPFYAYLDIPAVGASTIAADIVRVVPTFSTLPEEQDFVLRDTTISGGFIQGTTYDTEYSVLLVGWVLQ